MKIWTWEGRFYKQVKPVGSWKRPGCAHYALWQPVKRFLWLFWVDSGERFWLEPWENLKELK